MPKGKKGFQKGNQLGKGNQYNKGKHLSLKTEFKKGHIPWIKGKKLGFIPVGAFKKGHKTWNKDTHIQTNTGKTHFKKGYIPWIKGKHIQLNNALEIWRKNGGQSWNKGKKCPNLGGENHYCWKGGIVSEVIKIRNSFEMRQWRKAVFACDDYTCWICEEKRQKLNAHHLKKFSEILEKYNIKKLDEALKCEELWNISNGLTLCEFCHKTYTKFGIKKYDKNN